MEKVRIMHRTEIIVVHSKSILFTLLPMILTIPLNMYQHRLALV